ncbi:hypothetical protein [Fortiea contorta]|nr:hypothetical protein [Fortiea contorta]
MIPILSLKIFLTIPTSPPPHTPHTPHLPISPPPHAQSPVP